MTLVLSSLATPQPQPRVITARASDSAGEAASPASRRTVARTGEGGGGARGGAGAGARRLAGVSGRAAEAIARLGQRLTPRCGPRAHPRCREIVYRGSSTFRVRLLLGCAGRLAPAVCASQLPRTDIS